MEIPSILKGKHGKIFIFAALGVALVAFIMRKKGTTPSTETVALEGYPAATTTGNVGASGGTYTADTSNLITPAQLMSSLETLGNSFSDQLASEHDYQQAQLGSLQTANVTALNNLTNGLQPKFDSINTQIANTHSEMQSHTSDVSSIMSAIQSAFIAPVQAVESGFIPIPTAVPSGGAIAGGSSSDLQKMHTTPAASPVIDHTPNYGNGGINYNTATDAQKADLERTAKRLTTEPSFVESELVRTNKVIADRKAAGMDVTAQNDYLTTLNKQKVG